MPKSESESPVDLREPAAASPVNVRLGQVIEVRLEAEAPQADRAPGAWEFESLTGDALQPLEGAKAAEFLPGDANAASAASTYVFRYRAVQAGETKLQFDYLWPGGANERRRTVRLRSVTFNIVVAAN